MERPRFPYDIEVPKELACKPYFRVNVVEAVRQTQAGGEVFSQSIKVLEVSAYLCRGGPYPASVSNGLEVLEHIRRDVVCPISSILMPPHDLSQGGSFS